MYSRTHAYDDSDGVLELSSSLRLEQYFAPTSWPANNQQDLDMTTAPALFSDGDVLIAGKSRIAYLLDGPTSGGIGGQRASLGSLCSRDIDSGIAAARHDRLPPLPERHHRRPGGGITGLHPPPVELGYRGWAARSMAAGLVWTIGRNGTLYGLSPTNGAVRQQASIGAPANHFSTPGSVTASCWPRPPIRSSPLHHPRRASAATPAAASTGTTPPGQRRPRVPRPVPPRSPRTLRASRRPQWSGSCSSASG